MIIQKSENKIVQFDNLRGLQTKLGHYEIHT